MNVKKLATCLLAAGLTVGSAFPLAAQAPKPDELKVGISTFTSGSASVFGIPGKEAAELWIEQVNNAGGLHGVKVTPIFIDEGMGSDKLLTEYRRLVQEQGVEVMISAISSGNCNVVAPVAEDLQVLNILWDCGTEKVLENKGYKYVVRTQANAVSEMVATVLYLLKVNPDFKTIAVVNQDYAWGRDSWDIFITTLKALKPDVKVVAEMFPKFGAADFSTEITRLQALKPDVILNTSWGGDLDTFARQAAQRGLTNNSLLVLPLLESSLDRVGTVLPDGVIAGARGDHYYKHPLYQDDPKHTAFVEAFQARTNTNPIYPVYHMIQALDGMAAAYDKAIADNDGNWPTPEQVATAMRALEFRGLTSTVHMREDGQGLEDQLLGTLKRHPGSDIPLIDNIIIVPAEMVTTPVGESSDEWIKTLKPEILDDERLTFIQQ